MNYTDGEVGGSKFTPVRCNLDIYGYKKCYMGHEKIVQTIISGMMAKGFYIRHECFSIFTISLTVVR